MFRSGIKIIKYRHVYAEQANLIKTPMTLVQNFIRSNLIYYQQTTSINNNIDAKLIFNGSNQQLAIKLIACNLYDFAPIAY